jgi:homoserine kinase
VRVPATSANLGPGFDALGLSLQLYDDVIVRAVPASGGVRSTAVTVGGEGSGTVATDDSNLVVRALRAGVAQVLSGGRDELPSLVMECTNRIPHGRGLGSSAAAVVAGLLAARGLLLRGGEALDDATVLAIGTALEGHPDNVAATLLGGLTIAWSPSGGERPVALRLDPDPGVRPVVLVPAGALSTSTARGLLPPTVPHADATHAAGRSALLVAALTGCPEHLLAATEDRLHQGYRAAAMPDSARLLMRLRAAGLPTVVSGAGPSLLVLARAGEQALVEMLAGQDAAPWTVLALAVDSDGARLSTGSEVDQTQHPVTGRVV